MVQTHNFCRAHTTLTKKAKGVKMSPAMANRLTDHVWATDEVVELMDPRQAVGMMPLG